MTGSATWAAIAPCVIWPRGCGPSFAGTSCSPRYGGEEFAVVLPETGREGAVEMAERIRTTVAEQPFQFEAETLPGDHQPGRGGRLRRPCRCTVNDLIALADDKLYQAKREGRNRITFELVRLMVSRSRSAAGLSQPGR